MTYDFMKKSFIVNIQNMKCRIYDSIRHFIGFHSTTAVLQVSNIKNCLQFFRVIGYSVLFCAMLSDLYQLFYFRLFCKSKTTIFKSDYNFTK